LVLINSGDVEKTEKYVEENYAQSFKDAFPMDRHVGLFKMMNERHKILELIKTNSSNDYDIDFLLHSKTSDTWVNVKLWVEETDPYELIWIRDIFHNGYCGEKTVIFGHTPTKNLHKDKLSCSVYFGENRIIGIDGAAVYGGQLNCLQLPGNIIYSVKAKDKKLEKGEKFEKQTV